jgi:glucose-6-phosphate isomerase
LKLALFNDRPSSAPFAMRFAEERLLSRLQAIDAKARRKGLESLHASRNPLIAVGMESSSDGTVTKNGYGVFHLSWMAAHHPEWPAQINAELKEIRACIRKRHGVPLKFVIWAGMGGSAEDKTMYGAAGLLARGPRLYVLDSTDPAKLRSILEDITRRSGGSISEALKGTLVVGMAMGMTSYEPVLNLEKLARIYQRHGVDSQPNFIYMTLTGSLLDRFAAPKNYRRVELQMDGGNSTAGRHSAPLTRGSFYPLGLAGVDLDEWIRGAVLSEADIHTAWSLSSFLQKQGLEGRDKVTLVLSKSLAAAGLWTKQDFEESLGKSEEIGIKIVIGEQLKLADYRPAAHPQQDRVFVLVERAGERAVEARKLALLKRAGYSVAMLTLPKDAPLSSYLQFVHYAVFGLGWLRQMNFVTQPSVELYKSIASRIHENATIQGGIERTPEWQQLLGSPRQIKWRGGLVLHWDRLLCGFDPNGRDAPEAYAALLRQLSASGQFSYGELTFFGDTRYSPSGRKLLKALQKAGAEVFRERLKMPVDCYEGPAMNHSYHEMIIGNGGCLSTVLLSRKAAEMPECAYSAGYHRAQFLATQMALEQRARLVVAITLKDLEEPSLRALSGFFHAVAADLK